LYLVIQDHPNRQTEQGLATKKYTPRKEERYPENKTKRSPYMEKRKSVLMMRMRDQWTAAPMSDI
jgi:hypothetical protein